MLESFLNFKVIVKGILDPDNNFKKEKCSAEHYQEL